MLKLLGNLLAAPVKGPIHGFGFILDAIQEQVESEAFDESKVQGELMQLELRYQSGEMNEAEYEAAEDALLERLNEIRRYKEERAKADEEAGAPSDVAATGVENTNEGG